MSFFYISDVPAGEGLDRRDDVAIVAAGGDLDFSASPQLRERLADHVNAGRKYIVLDFSSVTFIDSTAVGALVGAVMRMHELGGGSLAVVCPDENRRVMRIFEIAGLDSLIALYYSREEALLDAVAAG